MSYWRSTFRYYHHNVLLLSQLLKSDHHPPSLSEPPDSPPEITGLPAELPMKKWLTIKWGLLFIKCCVFLNRGFFFLSNQFFLFQVRIPFSIKWGLFSIKWKLFSIKRKLFSIKWKLFSTKWGFFYLASIEDFKWASPSYRWHTIQKSVQGHEVLKLNSAFGLSHRCIDVYLITYLSCKEMPLIGYFRCHLPWMNVKPTLEFYINGNKVTAVICVNILGWLCQRT